jgi:exodeoxyribonuclease VII small subunit
MAKKTKPLNFESAITELNNLVSEMERGDLSLDEALKKFEQGLYLSRQCQQALQQAEQRVQILMQDEQGHEVLETFMTGEEE